MSRKVPENGINIVIQSLLKPMRALDLAFHIRYHNSEMFSKTALTASKGAQVPGEITTAAAKSSLIILRRDYSYLEDVIRGILEGASDVRVLVDRRFGERRRASGGFAGEDLRSSDDRRQSTPILDVVINLSETTSQ